MLKFVRLQSYNLLSLLRYLYRDSHTVLYCIFSIDCVVKKEKRALAKSAGHRVRVCFQIKTWAAYYHCVTERGSSLGEIRLEELVAHMTGPHATRHLPNRKGVRGRGRHRRIAPSQSRHIHHPDPGREITMVPPPKKKIEINYIVITIITYINKCYYM